jgi:hypothetical protein
VEFESYIPILFQLQFWSGLYLTGLIWTIQVVHYPSFLEIPSETFSEFHKKHSFRIGLIVIFPMVAELWGILVLFTLSPNLNNGILLVFVLVIWASTFFLQVPIHQRLEKEGKVLSEINLLISGNWIRTVAWTVKSCLCLYL